MSEQKERLPSINQALENAITERFCDICNIKVSGNKRYKEAQSKTEELHHKILPLLSEEAKKLFLEYSDATTREDTIIAEILYKQGLRDGLSLPAAWGKGCI